MAKPLIPESLSLDTKLGTNGSAVFLKPSIMRTRVQIQMLMPMSVRHMYPSDESSHHVLVVRMGFLGCSNNDMAVHFSLDTFGDEVSFGQRVSQFSYLPLCFVQRAEILFNARPENVKISGLFSLRTSRKTTHAKSSSATRCASKKTSW